jgi:hypothetical protein
MDTVKHECANCKSCGKSLAYKSVPDGKAALAVPVVDGPGSIEGYAAIFGNVDSQGERIIKGAFTKTIKERVPAGKVKLMIVHMCNGGSTKECIGTVTQAKEDDVGLWIHADLSSDQTAQDSRAKAREGHVTGLSIGYNTLGKSESEVSGEIVMDLTEIKLLEVTLTPFPANELAGVTSAKSIDAKDVTMTPPTTVIVPPVTVDTAGMIRRRKIALLRMHSEDCEHGHS